MTWFLTRGRAPFVAAVTILTAWLTWHAARVGVETNNESLNSLDPVQIERYARFRKLFGSDEDLLLAINDPALLQPRGVARIAAITDRVAAIPGVRHVFSLTTAKQIISGPDGAAEAPLVEPPFDDPDHAVALRQALDRTPDFTGWLASADRQTAGIVIEIEDRSQDDTFRAAIIARLRQLAAEYSRDGVSLHLTGIAVQKHDVTTYIERDQNVLMPVALAILAAMLAVFFRRVLGVLLPMAVTGISVAWTLGIYDLAGLKVNAITALLPPVIMVLSIAVSVHVIQQWSQAIHLHDRAERLSHVCRDLFFPCFFCSLTTALGFASLMMADMPAVRQFGIFASVGVVVSFAIGMTLVPAGLMYLEPPAQPYDTTEHRLLRRGLDWSASVSARHPIRILAIFTAITVITALGIPMIRNNTDLVRFMKHSAPLFQDTLFIDKHLTGTSTIEFVLTRTDGAPLTSLDDMRKVEQFEAAIRRERRVTNVTSILAVLRQLQRGEQGGDVLTLPDNPRDTAYLFDLLRAAEDRSMIGKMISPDFTALRVSVRMHEVGTSIASPLVDAMSAAGRDIFGSDYDLAPTGAFYHVMHDSNRLVVDQVSSFGSGFLAVFIAIGLLFRTLKSTIVSLIPNVMPLVWTAGMMGAFGIDLSSGTAMIASAVIGLVVDDTIHYLAEYHERFRGDPVAAVLETSAGVGAALVMNNLVLVFGFWVGCFGSFKPTIYFSLLSGTTMICAMICDLFVTPACLVLLDRNAKPVPA